MGRNKGKKVATQFQKHYKLGTKVLGEGAYGKVVLGVRLADSVRVAVKLMDKKQMKESDAEKMHKEVRILKSLNHPNVVRVFDYYDDEDYFKIVMEYVDGGELFEKLVADDGQYTEVESRTALFTLASALKHCKDKGVVHRDIKPENILLTRDGNIKLADFNLSKQIDVDMVDYKLLQTMCGTPNYVAPEVLTGRPYDFKCDVWSLGVIAFLLLSGGYLPFFVNPDNEGKDELLAKVKAGKWSFAPASAWRNVSDEAKDLISHMLVKKASNRYSYTDILEHPWFADEAAAAANQAGISGDRIRRDYKIKYELLGKKFEIAGKVLTAIGKFSDMMGIEAEQEDEKNSFEDDDDI